MSTQRNIRTRRPSSNTIALSLLVWIVGALVCSGMPVRAAASAQTAAGSQATRVDSSIQINVSGAVTAPNGTAVTVSGYVSIKCSAVPDITGVLASVSLTFDFSNVSATTGTGASKVTYDTKGFQCTKNRPLKASDVIQITVPYSQSGSGATAQTNTLLATATLTFNVTTGVLASGTITVGNNTFSSTT